MSQVQDLSNENHGKILFDRFFTVFIIGCIAGVLIEGFFYLFHFGHWESHVVSIIGYFNILYGIAAVLFYGGAVAMREKRLAVKVLILMLTATVLEYFTGVFLRDFLGMRAWNYTHSFMNFEGIISLKFTICWGILALAACATAPLITKLLNKINWKKTHKFCVVFAIFMVFNVGVTGFAIYRWAGRHYGIPAVTGFEQMLDAIFPDQWMAHRFMDWHFIW